MDHTHSPTRADWRAHLKPQEADDLRSLRALADFHGGQKKATARKIEAIRNRCVQRASKEAKA